MARTTVTAVQALLDTGNNYDGASDLNQFIAMGYLLVNRLLVIANLKGLDVPLEEQEIVERCISAHFYCQADPLYTSKSTSGASGSFARTSNWPYKDMAIACDSTGVIGPLIDRKVASSGWVGKVAAEQTSYDDRTTGSGY